MVIVPILCRGGFSASEVVLSEERRSLLTHKEIKMIRTCLKSGIAIFLTTLLLAASALAESRLQRILVEGELRVGTTGDWNPMTMIDPNSKERTGFDIDVAKALATDMGVKAVFVPTTWKTLVNGVVADKYDMTSSASLSPKRALVAGYSMTYFAVEDVPLMLEKNKGKYNSWEDLNNPNVTVAVTLGTVQEKRAEVIFDKSKIIKVSAPARDYQEVLAGRADISMTSNLEAAKLVDQYPEMMVVPVQEGKNPTPLAVLLPQADQVWINYVNHWIVLKTERGFFDQLEAKWLKQ
ncbi:uncharacterized protein METZ01_LOCUS72848 [marine metagenome]|uniref:Solute-binding protein family 3/N-terminal domain-containing protein n=1 Tax=marine metagenome TaxID=408172 RepID=A0A381TVY4_9ZZZZ